MNEQATASFDWFARHSSRLFDMIGVPAGSEEASVFREEAARRIIQRLACRSDSDEQGGRGMERPRFTDEMLSYADAAGINPRKTVDELWWIWDLAVGLSFGYVQWNNGMDPDIREAYPALKMSRFSGSLPASLRKKWKEAGGRIFRGSAIASKGDLAWVAVSEFGLPWPPFG
ncbi:hypothetical protein OJ996_05605 [Luteolibacter sp. GHJ8]|uniref:Uncharacterized protein n=1 Tax=Luteolibacter rhizosphaerae TaxID=2989719 RepID=A0ABT3G0J6_9BACT|nr:hypothetical protein [Luteolibacter rhizosphaerae]MCW1913036.1 hypothetical protein [Luteolibacter rhizosphaerae]